MNRILINLFYLEMHHLKPKRGRCLAPLLQQTPRTVFFLPFSAACLYSLFLVLNALSLILNACHPSIYNIHAYAGLGVHL